MQDVKWIKLLINTFEDEKIRLIQTTFPEGDSLVLIWLRLLCQAGKCNSGGYVYLNKNQPFTPEMLAALFGKSVLTINLALQTFRSFEMIDIDEKGFIWIENWEKHQNIDGMERAKQLKNERQKRWRDKQKLLLANSEASTKASTETSTRRKNDAPRKKKEERRKKKEDSNIKHLSSSLDDVIDKIEQVILFLNERADRMFGNSHANCKEIKSRLVKGASIEECKLVIDWKVSQWKHDRAMKKNLNPVTLFRASNFDRYLDEAKEELIQHGKDVGDVIAAYREDGTSSPFAEGSGITADSYFGHLVK